MDIKMKRQNFLRLYITLLAILAVALPILSHQEFATHGLKWVDFIFWGILVVGAELTPIILPKGGAALSVGGVIDSSILLIFPTPFAALYGAIAGTTSCIRRKVAIDRYIFNIAMLSVTMTVASLVVELAGAKLYQIAHDMQIENVLGPSMFISLIIPFIGAILLYFISNTGLTSIAISIAYNESPINVWTTNYKWMIVSVAAMGPIGLIIALVYTLLSSVSLFWAIIGVSIFFLPILIIRYAFKLFVNVNEAYFNSIKALVSALDASHHYTQGHSTRVSQNAETIAKYLKLHDKEVEAIRRGALLHDIGKIGLDKSILDKEGALSSSEWAQVKQHPLQGARIIGDLSFLEEARQIVLHHHERIDGKGYPYGLSGSEIPVGAKIVNALDSLDALTSDRAYRHALTKEQAMEILQNGAGEQFDRSIVSAVSELIENEKLVFQSESEGDEWDPEILFTLKEVEEALNIDVEGQVA